jgi:hypothetical protein
VTIAGYCSSPDPAAEYTPSAELLSFLNAGPAPVYIGFGSIVVDDPDSLRSTVFEAIRLAGVRAIVAHGWCGLGALSAVPQDVFIIDHCPHGWLFNHVAIVVHHCGCGTTAAGLRAGKPTVAVPFFGDQFFWAKQIEMAGAGPNAVPYRGLTAAKLASAIRAAHGSAFRDRLQSIAKALQSERGEQVISDSFHRSLPLAALSCSLDASRPATLLLKRAKKENLRLSAFAATVLIQNGVIHATKLQNFRPVEYPLDYGPLEPISGGFLAIMSLFYNTFKGISEAVLGLDALVSPNGMNRQSCSATDQMNSTAGASITSSRPRPVVASLAGCGRVVAASIRSPMTFSLALARGAHNAPKLWNDSTVREIDVVTGVTSGVYVGCKELFLGTYDGITGIFRLPVIGACEDGLIGALKGFGKGIVGAPVKMFSAMAAPVGYPLKGVDVRWSKIMANRQGDPVIRGKILQGEHEFSSASSEEKAEILRRWHDLEDC